MWCPGQVLAARKIPCGCFIKSSKIRRFFVETKKSGFGGTRPRIENQETLIFVVNMCKSCVFLTENVARERPRAVSRYVLSKRNAILLHFLDENPGLLIFGKNTADCLIKM